MTSNIHKTHTNMLGVLEPNNTDQTWIDQDRKQRGNGVQTPLSGLRHTPRSGVWPKAAARATARIKHRNQHQNPSKT